MTDLRDNNPTQPGWYATLHCWDADEGTFPGAHYWNGSAWQSDEHSGVLQTSATIQHWPVPFNSQEEAETYAYDNDPER